METIDRNYWTNNISSENISTVDAILTVINRCCKHNYELKYNKAFIGLVDGETPCHFVVIYPQKKQCTVTIKVSQDNSFEQTIATNFGEVKYKDGWYNFKVEFSNVGKFDDLKGVLVHAEAELRKELNIKGTKLIGTIQKEFNQVFPYLRIGIFDASAKELVAKGEPIYQLGEDILLANARSKNSCGDISINGNKKIKSIENEFDEIYGLYCKICYTESDGSRYYTSGSEGEKTLSAFNEECEKRGCKKGVYR